MTACSRPCLGSSRCGARRGSLSRNRRPWPARSRSSWRSAPPTRARPAPACSIMNASCKIFSNAVELAQRLENVEVRILEVGHPDQIARAIERDAYHVLHLSCHGGPGLLELEDEDGSAVPTSADDLTKPVRGLGRPLPLVFLSACHGGVEKEQTASFSESLLRSRCAQRGGHADVGQRSLRHRARALVLRAPGSPRAAAGQPGAGRGPQGARASAAEGHRLQAPATETQPEYATAALYVAGDDAPLADFSVDKEPLRERPVYHVEGPVPQLSIDELIGRRRELREALRNVPQAGVRQSRRCTHGPRRRRQERLLPAERCSD